MILLLICFQIINSYAQEDYNQNASSLFSGARLVKAPASYGQSSSTGLVSNYSPESIIDGSQEKIWCSNQKSPLPFVFEIELVETYIITELEFNNIVENYSGICAKDVVVEVSPSKKSRVYTTVLSTTIKEKDISRFKIESAVARVIRITIKSNYGNAEYTEMAEFQAFGKPKVQDIKLINIDGAWNSNWDNLTFRQNGTLVEGNYIFNNGTIRFGGIQRNKVSYTWIEDVIKRRGNTLMFMNEEGDELVGIWCYNNDWSNYGFWILNRNSGIPFSPLTNEEVSKEPSPIEIKEIKTETNIVREMENELKSQKKMVVYGINFKFNSAEILTESYTVLRQIYEVLNKNATMEIRIEGHTDNRGSDEYNTNLSLKRAESVRQFFIQLDIDKNRIVAEGKGERMPVADNESEMGRLLNRRVEIHLRE